MTDSHLRDRPMADPTIPNRSMTDSHLSDRPMTDPTKPNRPESTVNHIVVRRHALVGMTMLLAALLLVAATVIVAAPDGRALASPGPKPSWLTPHEPSTRFEPVTPCRVADTRSGPPLAPGADLTVAIHGRCGVPAEATAVALTVTGTSAARSGFVTLWPTGRSRPEVSNLNLSTGETRANSALVRLGRNGAITAHADAGGHLLIDITGVFVPAEVATSGRFEPIPPQRLLDTRAAGRPAAGSSVRIPLPAGVPSDAVALAVNLTTTDSLGGGYFTAHASGSEVPEASVLNTDGPGQTRAASAIVPVGPGGLEILTSRGDHLIVDVTGYFTGPSAPAGGTGLFVPRDPRRVVDTRPSFGLVPDGHRLFRDPSMSFSHVAGNITMIVEPGSGGFASLCAPTPTLECSDQVSFVNADAGAVANGFVGAAVDQQGLGWIRSSTQAHVLIDISGGFMGAMAESGTDLVPNRSVFPEPEFDPVTGITRTPSDPWVRQYAILCLPSNVLTRLDRFETRWVRSPGTGGVASVVRQGLRQITWIAIGEDNLFFGMCNLIVPHEAMHVLDYVSGDPSVHLVGLFGPMTDVQHRECLAQVAEVITMGDPDFPLSYDDDSVIRNCTRSPYAMDLGQVLWSGTDGTWFRWDGDVVVPR